MKQQSFERINLSATWNDASERFSLQGWVKNLTDVRVQAYQSVGSDGTMYVQWAEPRTYGATVGYKF